MNLLTDVDGSVMSMHRVVTDYPMFATRNDGAHFSDDVAVTLLRQRELEWSYDLLPFGAPLAGSTPEERLLSIYDVIDDWFRRDDYEACVIITLAIDMAKQGQLSRNELDYVAHVRRMVALFAAELDLVDPVEFALAWRLLMKGAIFAAMDGDSGAALRAKRMAASLIRSHTRNSDFDFDFDFDFEQSAGGAPVSSIHVFPAASTGFDREMDWLEYGDLIAD